MYVNPRNPAPRSPPPTRPLFGRQTQWDVAVRLLRQKINENREFSSLVRDLVFTIPLLLRIIIEEANMVKVNKKSREEKLEQARLHKKKKYEETLFVLKYPKND
ncbi:uncharacterized protein LOC132903454 [Amyelois transitella]|uniref:uncharacterized protein LOC132903454 n=1 Tax=Amyelois transitella TaxID=680683 RepID=UPI00298FF4B1|nr:uncharacterized protein LOC132903454 [Amyelois transitella]